MIKINFGGDALIQHHRPGGKDHDQSTHGKGKAGGGGGGGRMANMGERLKAATDKAIRTKAIKKSESPLHSEVTRKKVTGLFSGGNYVLMKNEGGGYIPFTKVQRSKTMNINVKYPWDNSLVQLHRPGGKDHDQSTHGKGNRRGGGMAYGKAASKMSNSAANAAVKAALGADVKKEATAFIEEAMDEALGAADAAGFLSGQQDNIRSRTWSKVEKRTGAGSAEEMADGTAKSALEFADDEEEFMENFSTEENRKDFYSEEFDTDSFASLVESAMNDEADEVRGANAGSRGRRRW